jgi:hypothetical protein
MERHMPPIAIRGKLHYIENETRLWPCPCEPAYNPPLNVLLAIVSGVPDDVSGATSYLKNLGWAGGTCVEIQGVIATMGTNVGALYIQQVRHCPTAPCNQ